MIKLLYEASLDSLAGNTMFISKDSLGYMEAKERDSGPDLRPDRE